MIGRARSPRRCIRRSTLSSLPLALAAILIIGGSIVLSILGLLAFHRYAHLKRFAGENEIAGFLYAVVGVVYGILLAFVVFAVYNRFDAVDTAVTTEAADMVAVFRDTQFLPPRLQPAAQADLVSYAHEVMDKEWADHGSLVPHVTPDPLNSIWSVYVQVHPTTPWQIALQQNANQHLYELERQRHLRHLSGESTLPDVFWIVLILGAILTVGFLYFFRIEDIRVQAAMTGIVACLIGSVLFLVVALNDPFTGQVHVSKYPFQHALLQFHALSLNPP